MKNKFNVSAKFLFVFSLGLSACLIWIISQTTQSFAQSNFKTETEGFKIKRHWPVDFMRAPTEIGLEFTEAVVGFGDPRSQSLSQLIQLQCLKGSSTQVLSLTQAQKAASVIKLKGHSHFVDQKTWIYQLDEPLPSQVVCQVTVSPLLKSLEGHALQTIPNAHPVETTFSFHTGLAQVESTTPWSYSTLNPNQSILLTLDQPLTPEESKRLVSQSKIEVDSKLIALKLESKSAAQNLAKKLKIPFKVRERVVLVTPTEVLPEKTSARLLWIQGDAQNQQEFNFQVRSPFEVTFNCERLKIKGPCLPVIDLFLNLSAEIKRETALKIKIRSERTQKEYLATLTGEDPWIQSLVFKAPLEEKTTFKVIFPDKVSDIEDRLLSDQAKKIQFQTAEYPPLLQVGRQFGFLEWQPDQTYLPIALRQVETQVPYQIKTQTYRYSGNSNGFNQAVGTPASYQKLITDFYDYQNRIASRAYGNDRSRSIFNSSEQSQLAQNTLERQQGVAASEMMGLAIKDPGLYVMEFKSPRLGNALLNKDKPMFVSTMVMVTGMSVHFKKGRTSSLAWVTELQTGHPVEGASVKIVNCLGALAGEGRSNADGVVQFDRLDFSQFEKNRRCPKPKNNSNMMMPQDSNAWFVFAQKDKDLTFTKMDWDQGIEPWRYRLNTSHSGFRGGSGSLLAHSVLDRTLFRQGETVSMKHFLRQVIRQGVQKVNHQYLPNTLLIQHEGSGQQWKQSLQWKDSNALSEFRIPKDAKLGNYSLTLITEKKSVASSKTSSKNPNQEENDFNNSTYFTGEFSVEDYKVPLTKGVMDAKVDSKKLQAQLTIAVQYLSGGPVADLPLEVHSQVTSRSPKTFSDYDRFIFTESAYTPPQKDSGDVDSSGETEAGTSSASSSTLGTYVQTQKIKLDSHGTAALSLSTNPPARVQPPYQLDIQATYRDASGQIQQLGRSVELKSSQTYLGIEELPGLLKNETKAFKVVALDAQSKPLINIPLEVKATHVKTVSFRKKIMNGFYSYENDVKIKDLGSICKGKTDQSGFLQCEWTPQQDGEIILQAQTVSKGESDSNAVTYQSLWVRGVDASWFSQEDTDRMDLIKEPPLKDSSHSGTSYAVGDQLKIQVRAPFKEYQALVTVEREGILDYFIQTVKGQNPVIEIPVKQDYAPNAYVSVLAVKGRNQNIAPTLSLDLGKPAYKLGLTEFKVDYKKYELPIRVKTDREVYPIRSQVVVDIDSQPGADLVVAVVDEGLLNLKENTSWKVLESMMRERSLEVNTVTSQQEVIGKRHFGLKGVLQGGGGGRAPTRQLFDTLLYWNPKVVCDANGKARVTFKTNDSLTSYRVVVIGNQSGTGSAGDRWGTAEQKITTNQDLIILSGVSPLARIGEKTNANFTLRNTTTRLQTVDAVLKIKSTVESEKVEANSSSLVVLEKKYHIDIPAGASTALEEWVEIPVSQQLTYQLDIQGVAQGDVPEKVPEKIQDSLLVTQAVEPVLRPQVYQATLDQVLPSGYRLPLTMPSGDMPVAVSSQTPSSEILVSLEPSINQNNQSLVDYMKSYPYQCFEQKVSRAIALNDETLWKKTMDQAPSFIGTSGFFKYFSGNTSNTEGSDVLSQYVLKIAKAKGWKIPETILSRVLEAFELQLKGQLLENRGSSNNLGSPQFSDLVLRKVRSILILTLYLPKTEERLTNWKEWLDALELMPVRLPTTTLLDLQQILETTSLNPELLKLTRQTIANRIRYRGSLLQVLDVQDHEFDYWWLLDHPDVTGIQYLQMLLNSDSASSQSVDAAKVMKGMLQRMKNGKFATTVANAWWRVVSDQFSERFEKIKPTGQTQVSIKNSSKNFVKDWSVNLTKQPTQPMVFNIRQPDTLSIQHQGAGSPWVLVQARSQIKLKHPIQNGFKMTKTFEKPKNLKIGDRVTVHVKIEVESGQGMVVIDEPIPTGAQVIATGSTSGNDFDREYYDEADYQENPFGHLRKYYSWYSQGVHELSYQMIFNQKGKFEMPNSRVEAMYAPELYAEIPNEGFNVE